MRPSPLHCRVTATAISEQICREHVVSRASCHVGLSLLSVYMEARIMLACAPACRFAGYVPGRHGNQRGHNQSAQHSPVKPTQVSGFYQLGFA